MAEDRDPKKPRVALVTAKFQNYEELIPVAMEEVGYDALWIDERVGNSFWAKFLTRTRLIRLFPRLLERHLAQMAERITAFQADVVLFVSPETLRTKEISVLRANSPSARFLLYMYDSHANRTFDQGFVDSFDIAYSFDPVDCDEFENLHHIPLFHRHDRTAVTDARASEPDYEYIFIGTARTRRIRILSRIIRKLRQTGSTHFVHVYAPSLPQFIYYFIISLLCGGVCNISRRRMDFNQYLDIIASAHYMLDIEQQNQNGLTIRTIDTIFSGTALATTNHSISKYDFYKHSNVVIFTESDLKLERVHGVLQNNRNPFFDDYHINNWVKNIISEKVGRSYHKND